MRLALRKTAFLQALNSEQGLQAIGVGHDFAFIMQRAMGNVCGCTVLVVQCRCSCGCSSMPHPQACCPGH